MTKNNFRIGIGYDIHRLVEGRDLVIGGIKITHEKGLLGHSDADVLTHALMDALLGAAGLGDIGKAFPDTDPAYAGISSVILLERVRGMLETEKWSLVNADITVIAQRPKLSPYLEQMKAVLADAMCAELGQLNIKATTEEGLGFTGSGEGIAAHAVVLIEKQQI